MNPEPPESSHARAGGKQLPPALRILIPQALRYGSAVGAVALAGLLHIALADLFGVRLPYITFSPAVMLVALLCGFGPGMLATGVSALCVAIWILPPVGQFAIADTADAIGLALFGCMGIFMSMVAGLYHQARAKLATYEKQLPDRQRAAPAPGAFPSLESMLTFKKRLAFDATLALVLVMLVSVGWLAYLDMTATIAADQSTARTNLVIDELGDLLSSLKDAETGQRGFIITGNEEYLAPYQASLGQIESHLAVLRRLTAGNSREVQRLAAITPLVAAKLAELKETIAIRKTKGIQVASDLVMTHLGMNLMDKIRALVGDSQQEEQHLLEGSTAKKEKGTQETIRSVFLGGTLGGLALLSLFGTLKLELARRYRAESELRRHRDHLEELVATRTQDLERINRALQTEASTSARTMVALRESHERLRLQAAALQAAANAIAITDRAGVIQWVNDAFTHLTGYSAAEVIGQNPRALKSGRHEQEFYKRMWETILAGRVWHGVIVNKRKDGGLYTEEMTITPVMDAGAITHFIAIKQDITERQQAEEEIRKLNMELDERIRLRTSELQTSNKELEAFCYSVSHDLRAPLRGINGFSQALVEDYSDKLDATGIDFLQRICDSCQRMAQLIDDLLNLSRLSRADMRRQPVSLSDLAREVAHGLRETTPGRAVEFRIAEGVTATGDPALLQVALSNLLANAWKFTAKGAESIIEFGVRQPDGHAIYFVRDNGTGFDMAYADKLFKPFQRLHAMREFPGTGIGLATVERVIRRHGGRVWAEAAPGQGATFYFTLEGELYG